MRPRVNSDPVRPPRTTMATPVPPRRALLLGLCWMLTATLAAAQEGASGKDLKGIVGEEITVPCDVGPKDECGDMHSIKWYHGDSRIAMYSAEDGKTALSGSFQPDRATFLPNENPPVLRINKIVLSDEGTFRCDVTYTQLKSGCPVVTTTHMKTLAIPQAPEIELEQENDEGDRRVTATLIGPFHENEYINLNCASGGGKPPAQVSWWKDNQSLGGFFREELDPDGTGTGQSAVRIKVTRSDLLSRYTCRVNHETLENREALVGAFVAWVQLDVFVPPKVLELQDQEDVMEKETVSMTCTASEARPAATISWFNGSEPITDLPPMVVEEQRDGTYMSTSTLTFAATRFDDEEVFTCQAANQAMDDNRLDPLKDSAALTVFYSPVVRVVPSDDELEILENSTLHLECLFEANPANESTVIWMHNDKTLHTASNDGRPDDDENEKELGEVANGAKQDYGNGGGVSSNDDKEGRFHLYIANISRHQSGNYSCTVTNKAGSGSSDNTVQVNVVYPPEVQFTISPTQPIIEHETNVTLTCEIEDANPPEVTSVRWYRDDEVFVETDETTLELPQVDRSVHRNYSCQAENRIGWSQRADPILINVLYTPGRATIVHEPRIAIKGEPLTMFCELDSLGNPPASYYFWKQGDFHRIDVETRNWSMGGASLQMQENYECIPRNDAGEGIPGTLMLDISAPPAFIDSLLPKHGALETATDISLTCQVECEPRCSIEWLRNGEVLQVRSLEDGEDDEDNDMDEDAGDAGRPLDRYSTKVSHLPENPTTGHFASVVSTLRWNMTVWPNGRLDRVLDTANYTCRSTPNLAGPSVVNTTHFQVEYPPENIKLSAYHLAIPEGEKSAPVVCSADGLPKVDYMWTYGDEVVSSTNELKLDYAASRHRVGQFVCTASNDHGKVKANVTIDVLYEPECTLVAKIDSKVGTVLNCEVVANPAVVEFQWFLANETVDENVLTDGTVSRLSHVIPGGRYTCVANNSQGLSEPCFLLLEGGTVLVGGFADNRIIIIVVVVAAIVIIAIIIAVIIIMVMKRRSAVGKYSNRMDLEQRENPEGHAHPDAKKPKPGRKPGVVTFKRVEPESTARAPDSQADKRRSEHPMGPVSDGDRAFYENLPFHGLQPAPNKDFNERPVPAPRDYSPTKMRHIYQNLLLPLRALKTNPVLPPSLPVATNDLPSDSSLSQSQLPPPPAAFSSDAPQGALRDGVVYADLALRATSGVPGPGVMRRDRPTEYAVLTFGRENTASEV